jgi:hypothetical protein
MANEKVLMTAFWIEAGDLRAACDAEGIPTRANPTRTATAVRLATRSWGAQCNRGEPVNPDIRSNGQLHPAREIASSRAAGGTAAHATAWRNRLDAARTMGEG